MALKNHSVFYYGHKIDETNNLIDFADSAGGPEITAEVPVGSYTLTKFLDVIVNAINAASALTWDYTIDRETRIVTFTSSGPADILFGTGTNALNSPAALLGFPASDILNDTSFVGTDPSGYEWKPQFPLQDYRGKDKNKKLVNAVVTESASGDSVSVQSFGVEHTIKMNAKYITNQPTEGLLRYDVAGVENATAFMDYVIDKNPVEFMEDETDRDTFERVFLKSSGTDGTGTSYELTEYVDRNLPEYFETGLLTFKVINLE